MTLNKKILAAAIVGGLFATAAQAQVNLSAAPTASTNPTLYAAEILASTTAPVTLTAITQNQLTTTLNYAFSEGEVRYARFECSPNYRISATTPAINTTLTSGTAVTGVGVGAVNGAGTNVINFSITAPTAGLAATNAIILGGARTITSATSATCAYSLYDTPSQAQNGGTTGLITTTGQRPAATFASSLALRSVNSSRIADVEAAPSFSAFTTGNTVEDLAQVYFGLRNTVSTALADSPVLTQPRLADGTLPADPSVFIDATASHVVSGDFSLAANANGTFTGAALARVYFATSNACPTAGSVAATALTSNSATFEIGATEVNGLFFCVQNRSGNLIAASDYAQTFNAVSVAPTTYAVTNIGPVALGSITRNGTSLQAPFVQVPAGWLSRIVLTNTGSVARPYTITAQTEAGTTATLGTAATGSIPANGTIVLKTADIATFTGEPRGTLNVSVSAPTTQVQGLYQIVNGQTGSIANTAMQRPGTN